MDPQLAWHGQAVATAAAALGADVTAGLSEAEAARRLAQDGPNTLVERRRRGPFLMFLAQFTEALVVLLLVAAVLAGAIGEVVDAAAILVIVLLNATFGFLHERGAESALDVLRALATPRARVRRAGTVREVPASTVVRGDLVLLEAGNVVPADLRLVEVGSLRVDEAILTGESQPVDKVTEPGGGPDLPLGDRRCLAFGGTLVTYGRGVGLVTATGMATELGRIVTRSSSLRRVCRSCSRCTRARGSGSGTSASQIGWRPPST